VFKKEYWFPTTLIQRYLAAHFIPPFIGTCFFFVAFLLTFQLFKIIRIMTAKSVELTSILELMGHIGVSFLPMAVPLSTLFAAIYTMNKMSEDSELVAMRSFGLSKRVLITPFLTLGLMISAVIFVLNTNLIPHSKTQFKNKLIGLGSQGLSADIKPGQFYIDIPGVTLFAEEVSDGGTKLGDVFILLKRDGKEQIIAAKKGAIIKQEIGELRTPMMRLHLEQGNIVKILGDGKNEKILFQEYDFPIISGGELPSFVSKDSMKSSHFLKKDIEKKKEELKSIKNKKSKDYLNKKRSLSKSLIEYWGRFNTPLQVLIFSLIGFCLGIKRGRGRSKSSGQTGFIILIIYYALFFTGISMAKKGNLSPAIAVFTPTFLALFLTGYYYHRVDWRG